MSSINFNNAGISNATYSQFKTGGRVISYQGSNAQNYTGTTGVWYSTLENRSNNTTVMDTTYGDYATLFNVESDGAIDVWNPLIDMLVMVEISVSSYIGATSDINMIGQISYDPVAGGQNYTVLAQPRDRRSSSINVCTVRAVIVFEAAADSHIKTNYAITWNTSTPTQIGINTSIHCLKPL